MGNAGSIITEAKSRGNTFFQSKKYRSAVEHYRHAPVSYTHLTLPTILLV